MPEGNCGPYHHFIDSLGSCICEIFIVLTAVAITVLAERTYVFPKSTLSKTLTVEFEAFRFLAVALCDDSLVGILKADGYLVRFLIAMIARRVHGLVDNVQESRGCH